MFYDYEKAFASYDNLTFQEWADSKYINKKFYEIMLKPALSVSLNEGEVFRHAFFHKFISKKAFFLTYFNSIFKRWRDSHVSADLFLE
jgi:hypothetical protein